MAARRPFWKWHRWKSIGFCLWTPSTCIWNLKLKFQSKLDLCSGNHVVYRQTDRRTDGRTDKVNPVYPPSNFVGRGYNNRTEKTGWVTHTRVGLTHWGRDKVEVISQTTFSSAFSWMKMFEFRLKFHCNLFLRLQLTILIHWFRWWLGAVQVTSHYLNKWWLVYRRIFASLGLNELIHWPLRNVAVVLKVYFSNSYNTE